MNTEEARQNMLKQQLRTNDVLNEHLLALLTKTPREHFVPAAYQNLAFADHQVPLAHDQVMMSPMEESKMLQALMVQSSDRLLEIGTGSGYITAILAQLGACIDSLDIFADFTQAAEKRLHEHGIKNANLITADVFENWKPEKTYDVIVITGATPLLPPRFTQYLSDAGRLFAIIGEAPNKQATLMTRGPGEACMSRFLFTMDIPNLIHAPQADPFQF